MSLEDQPWRKGYERTILISPDGRRFPSWTMVERRDEERCPYPGALPEPLPPALHVRVAVLSEHSRLACATMLLHEHEPWSLRWSDVAITLYITSTEMGVDGVIEFSGPLVPQREKQPA